MVNNKKSVRQKEEKGSKLEQFRSKSKMKNAISTAQQILQHSNRSDTVRHLVSAGLYYVKHIEKRKEEIKEEFKKYGYAIRFDRE